MCLCPYALLYCNIQDLHFKAKAMKACIHTSHESTLQNISQMCEFYSKEK